MDKEKAFFFMGAHPKAGTSTLAHMIAPSGDGGDQWPTEETVCVLVCDSTLEGLDHAHQKLVSVPEQISVLGLVVVSCVSGKPSRAVSAKIRILQAVTNVWEAPYIRSISTTALENLPLWEPALHSREGRKKRLARSHTVPAPIADLAGTICKTYVSEYHS